MRTVEAANRWLREVYLAQHNARFAVPAEQPGTAFVADPGELWRDILCVHENRVVGNDNTVIRRRLRLQLPPSPLRPHFVRATVRVREYWDNSLSISLGPHRLADFAADGTPIDVQHQPDRVTPLDATGCQGLAPARKTNRADTSLAT